MVYLPLLIAAVVGLAIWLRPWPLFVKAEESSAEDEATSHRNVALDFGKWVERQARSRGLSVRGVARPTPLECPKCRKTSNYFVYPDELCERCWRATLTPVNTPAKNNRT